MCNDNPDFQPYIQGGGWSHDTSRRAGRDQALRRQPCSGQQWNESAESYETRRIHYALALRRRGIGSSSYPLVAASLLALSACGGGGGGGVSGAGNGGGGGGGGGDTTFTVGGSVAGLAGGLVLQDNGVDSLTLAADGSFAFATSLASGADYAVTVATQPAGQTCSVVNGAGQIGSSDVTNVAVSCTNSPPSTDLIALAASYVALRTASALPVMEAVATGAIGCDDAGSVAAVQAPPSATFAGCDDSFDRGDAWTGNVDGTLLFDHLHGLSLAVAEPLAATVQFGDQQVFAVAAVSGNTLTETFATQGGTLAFTFGSASRYLLGSYTIGSPSPMTRVRNADGSVTSTIAVTAGSVTYNDDLDLLVSSVAPIVWNDSGYPTTGSLGIDSGTALALQAQFLSGGRLQLEDPLTGLSATKSWSDADVQAALRQVTQ